MSYYFSFFSWSEGQNQTCLVCIILNTVNVSKILENKNTQPYQILREKHFFIIKTYINTIRSTTYILIYMIALQKSWEHLVFTEKGPLADLQQYIPLLRIQFLNNM